MILVRSAIGLCFLLLFGGANSFSMNLSCNEDYYGYTYGYINYDSIYNNYYHYDDDDSIYYASGNELVQYFLYKILEKSSSDDKHIESLNSAFTDNVEQEIEITYNVTVPCKKKAKVIKTKFTFTEQRVFQGILKGTEEKIRKESINIEMKTDDGFDESCEHVFCGNEAYLHDSDYEVIFCQVTNLLYLKWLYIDRSQVASISDSIVGEWSCYYQQFSTAQIWQYAFFEFAMGIFHLILFILLVKYRFKFHDYISKQTQGNKVRSLLFWSFIVSINLLYFYVIMITIIALTNRQVSDSEAYDSLQSDNSVFDIISIIVSTSYLVFFILLHLPVVYCCMCSCNEERSSTDLCIPGTCFSRFPVCSYPFRSFAFYVINIIPHLVLFLVSLLALRFSSAPIPSVTVLFYFILLLFANVIFNALSINLITSMCKNNKCCRRCCCRCCYCFFGFLVAIGGNIMTVIVVISLVDYLLNTTEETSYSAILPGIFLTVLGWYFSGDIAKYTGIDLSVNVNSKTDENIVDVESGNKGNAYEIKMMNDQMELKKKH